MIKGNTFEEVYAQYLAIGYIPSQARELTEWQLKRKADAQAKRDREQKIARGHVRPTTYDRARVAAIYKRIMSK